MKKLNVLVVDDDFINLKLLKAMLTKHNLFNSVLEAKNGMEALEILEKEPVDLVLLDILMPVMDGLQFIEIVRSRDEFKDIPIIVLSTDELKKSKALELGANDFMEKPIRESDLLSKIKLYAGV